MQRQKLPADAFADLLLGRLRRVVQEVDRRHDHAGSAEAALQAVLLPEALLKRVQVAVLREPLDRDHLGAVGLDGEDRAGLGAAAVDEHGAGAALAGIAADVRAGEIQLLAQKMHQQRARLRLRLPGFTVDGD